jgi:hypothetical protein
MAPRAIDTEGTAKSVYARLQKERGIPTPYFYPLSAIAATPGTALHPWPNIPDVYKLRRQAEEYTANIRQYGSLENPEPNVVEWLQKAKPYLAHLKNQIESARGEMWSRWERAYGKSFDLFWKDCKLVGEGWGKQLKGWTGEAVALDTRLGANAAQINETVEEATSGRRRSNSLPEALGGTQEKVQEAYDKASTEPRSFIRTWVRIAKSG